MNIVHLYLNLDWFKVFYLVGALLALTIAVLAHPTLVEKARHPKPRKSTKR